MTTGPIARIGIPGTSQYRADFSPLAQGYANLGAGLGSMFQQIGQQRKEAKRKEDLGRVMSSLFAPDAPTAGAGPGTGGTATLAPTRNRSQALQSIFGLSDPQDRAQALQAFQLWDRKAKPTGRWEPVTDDAGNILAQRHTLTGETKADPRAAATGKADTAKDAAGFLRYLTGPQAGARVFPGVEKPAEKDPAAILEFTVAKERGLIKPETTFTEYLSSKRVREVHKEASRAPAAVHPTFGDVEKRVGKGFAWDYDPKTKTYRMNDDGTPRTVPIPGAKTEALSETQGKAATFADRLQNVEDVLSSVDDAGNALDLQGASYRGAALEMLGPAGNPAKTAERQRYEQAKRNFINAVLRRESGAVIAQEEFDNADQQYFPIPGDKPAVIAQKRQNRADARTGMIRDAGPRYAEELRKRAVADARNRPPPPAAALVPGGVATAAGSPGLELPTPDIPPVPQGPAADLKPGMFQVPLPGSSVGLSGLSIPATPEAPPTPAPAPNLVPGGAAEGAAAPMLEAAGLTAPAAPEATTNPAADLRALSEADFLALATQVKQNPGAFPPERMILLADEWERRNRERR